MFNFEPISGKSSEISIDDLAPWSFKQQQDPASGRVQHINKQLHKMKFSFLFAI